ncbi:sensor domain-containing diguanylate cyclase [Pseudohongiella sp.]|uniref:Diguanylate cyclase n=2 Tax=root TaxID=1 RepID=A0A0F9YAI4_9ZZZZ|nr:sensor domain-containing diguanylate cyclase [Pseudohongiella sp.]HDZ07978.1 sensor domain-containing diguanylate cyclase [Pseudohongiella sp.]
MRHDFADRDLLLGVLGEVRDAVLITDARLALPGPVIVYANPAFCAMTGYEPEELVGQTPRLMQGPLTDKDLMQRLKEQLVSGQAFFGETVNYRKDGSPFRMEWSIRPYPATGTPRYFIAIQRDVTALRDLEQQRRQLQALTDIQTKAGTAGLNLQAMREQVAQIGLAITGADGAAVEEAAGKEMVYTAAAGTAMSSLGLRLPVSGSLSGACYRDRVPMYCRDTHNEPRVAREAADRVGFRSGLLVPMIHEERCFGVLKVYSSQVGAFSDSDLDILNMASRVLASSLYDAQSFEQQRQQRTQLIDALPILIARIDMQLCFREINAGYTEWFQRPAGQIIGKPAVDVVGPELFEQALPYMQAALAGEEVIFEQHLWQPDGSMMPVELTYIPQRDDDGQVVGFYSLARDISDRRRAERDHLTQTLNRRGFDARLDIAFATAKRYQRPLSLIFVDLDHFKKVNDNYGHAVGDEVLRTAAQVLCEQVRDSDIVSRWGGEEFVILAPETPLAEAAQLSERLRQRLAFFQHPEVGQVTASFGVTELASEQSERDFINHADQALYAAKGAGRNRVECYRP